MKKSPLIRAELMHPSNQQQFKTNYQILSNLNYFYTAKISTVELGWSQPSVGRTTWYKPYILFPDSMLFGKLCHKSETEPKCRQVGKWKTDGRLAGVWAEVSRMVSRGKCFQGEILGMRAGWQAGLVSWQTGDPGDWENRCNTRFTLQALTLKSDSDFLKCGPYQIPVWTSP